MANLVIRFTILGEPASKANSRRLVSFGGRPAIVKSKKALEYEKAAQLQIPQAARVMFAGSVRVTLRIFYASERPDLDESVVLDVLQAKYSPVAEGRELVRAGVYANDRQVREKHVFHAIDRLNPRVDIEVEELVQPMLVELEPVQVAPRKRMQRVRVYASEAGVTLVPQPDGNPF